VCDVKVHAENLDQNLADIVRATAYKVMVPPYFEEYRSNAGMLDMCLGPKSLVGMLEMLQVWILAPPPLYRYQWMHTMHVLTTPSFTERSLSVQIHRYEKGDTVVVFGIGPGDGKEQLAVATACSHALWNG
jgi:hypothetical protein